MGHAMARPGRQPFGAGGTAAPAAAQEQLVEVSARRLGYSERHRAAFATVSVRNVSRRDLRILTVQCRFEREDGRWDTTMLLFRDLAAGDAAEGFTYAHSSVPAVSVDCRQSGARY